MTTPKKVLIACPTLGLDPDPNRWLVTLLRITNGIRKAGMSHACFFPYRENWWNSNNMIWNVAFQGEFDWILRCDDDVWGAAPDAFQKLLDADKDVIGASYPVRQFPYAMCAFKRQSPDDSIVEIWKTENRSGLLSVQGRGVQECDLVGFGMTLIKVEPFLMLERPIYKGQEVCPDDTYFAQLCYDNGIKQHVHMDVQLCHREVTPHNRMYLFNADARGMLAQRMVQPGTRLNNELIEMFGADGQKDFGTLKGFQTSPIIQVK